ncbi:uncharacterized protein BDZ99DRAFT_523806 [Mytilinidion resinicola]|uniref:Uncharacterized protein n=1 Tax=Mytilinidion resinicola TaxID=574789 RepID=A0A6A6YES3_9PEZI|nr:uncharacterized protein BDZ99DRAFT_523806 [Mytilinidion resinicola]KAF2806357.1 hypothetical protein BDZ99DRAFT_523806 [Mytilinidion resinicola]
MEKEKEAYPVKNWLMKYEDHSEDQATDDGIASRDRVSYGPDDLQLYTDKAKSADDLAVSVEACSEDGFMTLREFSFQIDNPPPTLELSAFGGDAVFSLLKLEDGATTIWREATPTERSTLDLEQFPLQHTIFFDHYLVLGAAWLKKRRADRGTILTSRQIGGLIVATSYYKRPSSRSKANHPTFNRFADEHGIGTR